MAKKYYWLKLMKDFFQQPKIKKLRRIAGGDTYTVIYLKMQLLSLENDGQLYYEGIEADFAEELALTIDEDVDNVRFVLLYLKQQGLIEEINQGEYVLLEAVKCIGSEVDSAERVRRFRERKKSAEALPQPESIEKALHGNACVTTCNTEIEKEIEKEKDKDSETNNVADAPKKRKSTRFIPPTVEEVAAYCKERKNSVDPQLFVDFYTGKDWYVGKTKMVDWKASVRTWERNRKNYGNNNQRQYCQSPEDDILDGIF